MAPLEDALKSAVWCAVAGALSVSLFLTVPSASAGASSGAAAVSAQTARVSAAAQAPRKNKKKKKGYFPQQGPKFNLPRSGASTQFRIEAQVLSAIRHARKGSIIRMSMFSFDRYPVADALIAAKRRGVKVQVLINNHEDSGAQKKMRRFLGTNRFKNKSFAYQCKFGCRSRGGILHSKYILFSKTGKAKNVVMLGSVNMKLNGAKNQYNDLLTINNVDRLHSNLTKYFIEMRRDKPARPAYWKHNISKSISVRASPWAGARKKDPNMEFLAPVRCLGAQTPNGRTRVMINMHAWDGNRGAYLANRVRDLYAQGCDVRIQYGYGGRKVRQILSRPTARGRIPLRSNGLDTDSDGEIDLYSHMKLLLVDGNYGGVRNRKVIVTGSNNYQGSRNVISGDELIFRMYSSRFFGAYRANFDWMWANRTRPVQYLRRLPDGRILRPAPEPTMPPGSLID